jgi:hypothetical protein
LYSHKKTRKATLEERVLYSHKKTRKATLEERVLYSHKKTRKKKGNSGGESFVQSQKDKKEERQLWRREFCTVTKRQERQLWRRDFCRVIKRQ